MEAEASSRDLLQRFAGSTTLSDSPPPPAPAAPKVIDEDGELSLGLSLGGRFSSNPREKTNMLIRSSSISSLLPLLDSSSKLDDANFHVARAPLHRTCSLPVPGAADEDYRKRKEMQTLKRLEAKRKRLEKRSSLSLKDNEKAATWLPPISHRASIGSVGSSSSGGGAIQGFDMVRFSNISEAKSSSNILKTETRGIGVSEMEEMPCVSTTGNSPNGKRVEGFLYKYRKGEEVRIVCVCHGNFLTPAEFVRHAGLGDVDHPLRHIVVSPPSPFL